MSETNEMTIVDPVIPEVKSNEDVDSLAASFSQLAALNTQKLTVLINFAKDLVSEKPRSDSQMARDLGMNRHTIGIYRSDPEFSSCLALLIVGIARGRTDLYLRWTEEAAKGGSVGALKLLWEISGIYVARSKSINVNMDMNFNASEPTTDYVEAVDEFLIALGEAGWSSAQVASRMNELRASGAW